MPDINDLTSAFAAVAPKVDVVVRREQLTIGTPAPNVKITKVGRLFVVESDSGQVLIFVPPRTVTTIEDNGSITNFTAEESLNVVKKFVETGRL